MSETKKETLADIAAELREISKMPTCGYICHEQIAEYADRIEAAGKREKSELVEKAESEKRWADHYYQKWHESGNLMKMREALETCIARADEARNYLLRSADTKACMEELINVARDAIAEPPRNCDMFPTWEKAAEAWGKSPEWSECPDAGWAWLFDPAKKEGGK